jgi:hypothetical protein
MSEDDHDKKSYTGFQLLISIIVVLFSLKHCVFDPLTESSGGSSIDRCMEHRSESDCLD